MLLPLLPSRDQTAHRGIFPIQLPIHVHPVVWIDDRKVAQAKRFHPCAPHVEIASKTIDIFPNSASLLNIPVKVSDACIDATVVRHCDDVESTPHVSPPSSPVEN